MKIAIFGAGAIGGLVGVKLAMVGADVTFIARGPHLAAMQANGVTLKTGGETIVVHPRRVASAAEAGRQDYVLVTLKAHSLPGGAVEADRQAADGRPDSTLVTGGVNGVPYWYFSMAWTARGATGRSMSVDPGRCLVAVALPPSLGPWAVSSIRRRK